MTCRTSTVLLALALHVAPAFADDSPQWLGPARDNVFREPGLASTFPAGGPKTLWRATVSGGYAQPAIAGDRVIVTDRVAGRKVERVLCLDDATGKEVWKVEYACPYTISYDAGPRATPAIDGGRVYTLGAEGHVHCIELATGKVLWNKKLPGKPAMWGYVGSPLVDGDRLILLSSGKPLLTALNKATGEPMWTALEVDDPGYAPPTLMTLGGRRQIVQYHPTGVAGVDPADGRVLWQVPYGPEQNGVTIVTPVQLSADTFLIASNWEGMAAIQARADGKAKTLWHAKAKARGVTTLAPLHSQMVLHDGLVYGVHKDGPLVCVDPKDGRVVWKDAKPLVPEGRDRVQWGTGFLTPWRPDPDKPARHFYLGTDTGDLILCHLSAEGYKEVGRAHLLDPTNKDPGRAALWSNPAYAHGSVYWRSDKELVRVSLTAHGK